MNKPFKNARLHYLLAVTAIAALLVSCFKDDTTLGVNPISEIAIESIHEVYNINRNDTLIISPLIAQSQEEKEITYTWEINLEPYSHDRDFVYVGKELGTFQCRLIVENSDGKSFAPFTLHVNTPYEEGVAILSKDADGQAMLSFMLTPSDGSAPSGFMHGDQFTRNNEQPFADNPVDMVQSSGTLIIACQGSHDGNIPATIYCLNEKTLVIENMVSDSEFTDFKPTILGIPATTSAGRSYPVICEGGHTYEFSTTEGVLSSPIKLPHTYAQTAITYTQGGGYYNFLCWDKELNALAQVYSGYAPAYYCAKEYNTNRDSIINNPDKNVFKGLEICKMVLVEQTKDVITIPKALVITKNARNRFQKTLLSVDFWEYRDGANTLIDDGGYKICGAGQLSLTETTPCVANHTYQSMLFAEGNKVHRWYYTTAQHLTASDELQAVGSDSAIITAMSLSRDHKKTYVAFYEPEQLGLNGSVWMIDTDSGEILEKYNNVCYQPVKVIYKTK